MIKATDIANDSNVRFGRTHHFSLIETRINLFPSVFLFQTMGGKHTLIGYTLRVKRSS